MRNYTIIENDVIMADVWAWAQSAGFTSLELTVFNSQPFRLSLPDFDDFLRGGPCTQRYVDHVREVVRERRIFFLAKGEPLIQDSRDRNGLAGTLEVQLDRVQFAEGEPINGVPRAQYRAKPVAALGCPPWPGPGGRAPVRSRRPPARSRLRADSSRAA